jgi:hypothetical protein
MFQGIAQRREALRAREQALRAEQAALQAEEEAIRRLGGRGCLAASAMCATACIQGRARAFDALMNDVLGPLD